MLIIPDSDGYKQIGAVVERAFTMYTFLYRGGRRYTVTVRLYFVLDVARLLDQQYARWERAAEVASNE